MKDVEALVEQMRKSPYIREKRFGNISSFNFTKKAFYGQHWDELTVRARGLFVDTREMRIVARGYDKFFELPKEGVNCTYPLRVYRKENGFSGSSAGIMRRMISYSAPSPCVMMGRMSRRSSESSILRVWTCRRPKI